jgi:hypothetical protein
MASAIGNASEQISSPVEQDAKRSVVGREMSVFGRAEKKERREIISRKIATRATIYALRDQQSRGHNAPVKISLNRSMLCLNDRECDR